MATALDVTMRALALDIVNRYGQDAIFVVPASTSYDPSTGEATEASPTEYTEKISPPRGFKAAMIDGDVIRRGDRQAYIAASGLSFTPVPELEVQLDGGVEKWRVVSVQEIYSGEQVAAYVLQMRR